MRDRGGGGGLVSVFARHPTAANLLMAMMIVAGLLSLQRLNTQFFPEFGIDVISVGVVWPGASASDVEETIVGAIEPEVRFIDGVDNVISAAREGQGTISIEFQPGTDMQEALANVESAVAQVTTLPEAAERPVVRRIVRYDTISRISVSGPFPESSLKMIAKRIREDLLARGIDKVTLTGARDEEIWIEVAPETLLELDLTLADIAERVRASSRDIPAGETRGAAQVQLRSLGQAEIARDFADIEIKALESGEEIELGTIAALSDRFDDSDVVGRIHGDPAIELHVQRAVGADALELAGVVDGYLDELRPTLPPTLELRQYDVAATLISDRINLLLRNGGGGLLLVLAVLFLFLTGRVAFWVAVGIPVSLMATLAVMLVTGQSINMVSLFALIMMLGIIVDDAIVVGEHAATRRALGDGPAEAAETGARRMVAPVMSASLTTVAAFLPVLMISGLIGEIIQAIPYVVVAVIIASLIECFLVLPGHLRGALSAGARKESVGRGLKARFHRRFEHFRDNGFRRLVALAVRWRYATLAVAVATLIVAVGLVAGGRVKFVFFPSPEGDVIFANFAFASGTPRDRSEAMLRELERSLAEAEAALTDGEGGVVHAYFGQIGDQPDRMPASNVGSSGDNLGGLQVELKPSERRDVRTQEMIAAWRGAVEALPGLDSLTIRERRGGPPGRDIDIRLSGGTVETLKAAALDLRERLTAYNGVTDVDDNLPYGKRELILSVTPRGAALGFTTESVGRQVRDAFEGIIVQRFARGDEEVTVRVQYPRGTIDQARLRNLYLRGPGGREVALREVVSMHETRGFAIIRREDGVREVSVTGEIDSTVANPNEVLAAVGAGPLPELARQYDIDYRLAGRAEEQAETLGDMKTGTLAALVAIYLILAWVFASYSRPLVVMSIIPFAIVGAVFGHFLLGFDLTILSLVALLGLSGIVVNDSIILVSTIDERIRRGEALLDAIVDGSRDRLRAVILTSLSTIGGLVPLLAETSLQAQFLKPMALTLVFGLLGTTVLVLILAPSVVAILDDGARLLGKARRESGRLVPRLAAPEARQKEDEHGEELEPAEEHGGGKQPLGTVGERRKAS